MDSQIELFRVEFNRCTRCFMLYCEENVDENGNLPQKIVDEALEGFKYNLEIAYKIAIGESELDAIITATAFEG